MSKEFTIFVVDPAAASSPGIQLWYDHCSSLLLKNRKSDRIGMVFNELHYADQQFTYANFHEYSKIITSGETSLHDVLSSTYTALDAFKEKIRLKFTRNLIVITNEFPSNFSNDYLNFIETANIRVYVVSQNDPGVPDVSHLPYDIDISKSSTLKKSMQRVTYAGCLRFGKGSEDSENGEEHISIDIHVHPAVKKESFINGHEYVVKDHKVSQVKRNVSYYVKNFISRENESENEDDAEFEKEAVPGYTYGFKYSKRDLKAIKPELESVVKLQTTAGMDILGVIKRNNFPYTYLMNETSYVVPSSNSMKNLLSYKSFVKALVELDILAIVRFVPSDMAEVVNCVLLPKLFATNTPMSGKFAYGLFMARIPFKEDEKMGRFPKLQNTDSDINSLMESFIESKDLDKMSDIEPAPLLDNPKLNLLQSELINLPRPQGAVSVDASLVASSPAIYKFNMYLKRLIINSLKYPTILDYLDRQDVISSLTTKESNLYNLENILQYDATNMDRGWMKRRHKESISIAQKLVDKIEVELKVPTKKPKREPDEGGDATHFDGFFDPLS